MAARNRMMDSDRNMGFRQRRLGLLANFFFIFGDLHCKPNVCEATFICILIFFQVMYFLGFQYLESFVVSQIENLLFE